MKLLEPQAFTIKAKITNILLAFIVTIGWITFITHFLDGLYNLSITPFGLFFIVFIAPLWEELAFRVIPIKLASLLGKEYLLPIILLSSIIFGWGHGLGPVSLLIQGVGGVILSILYIRNNYCYWSSVSVHFLWNLYLTILN